MYLLDTNILVYYLQGINKVDSFVETAKKTMISIIAATAWHFDAYLVTHDNAFKKIKKIKVIDPFDEA